MSISGVESRSVLPFVQPGSAERGGQPQRRTGAPMESLPAPAEPVVADVAALDTTLPAAPPAGTDPELWAVLTSEERAYFARFQSLGPLTYGRGERAPTLPRGGRIDVQV